MRSFLAVAGIMLLFAMSGFIGTPPPSLSSKAALGKRLFSEKILSKDSSVSCASCHKPEFAFADTAAFSTGIYGKLTGRNTPSVLNMKNRPYYFWDGRAASLQEQALMPIENPDEMGLPADEAVKRLNRSPLYTDLFYKVFKQKPTKKNLADALAAFEQTLETVNSRFDDWSNGLGKLSVQEERGRQLFVGQKAKCFECHSMEDFTDDEFRNIGIFNGQDFNDSGRYRISRKTADIGRFKTPGLRNVAVTPPYMHNGRFKTLEQVISFYNNPQMFVDEPKNMDPLLKRPLGLSLQEEKDIIAFLHSLTDRAYRRKKALTKN
ncbi:MAG: cytochrome c peroxidase [Ferruginibacter sp.]